MATSDDNESESTSVPSHSVFPSILSLFSHSLCVYAYLPTSFSERGLGCGGFQRKESGLLLMLWGVEEGG
ncbi:hypothetical protein A4A49_27713 [Nicotiana attenuata]|uniref:Uncharacterized protein n=1 Tax=Nicotiana attenuata TaxID=49451 RepID=A0A314L126_NICAT|nr:hypothetical protein A4A49_27713 [Nicotiana attenuata]